MRPISRWSRHSEPGTAGQSCYHPGAAARTSCQHWARVARYSPPSWPWRQYFRFWQTRWERTSCRVVGGEKFVDELEASVAEVLAEAGSSTRTRTSPHCDSPELRSSTWTVAAPGSGPLPRLAYDSSQKQSTAVSVDTPTAAGVVSTGWVRRKITASFRLLLELIIYYIY